MYLFIDLFIANVFFLNHENQLYSFISLFIFIANVFLKKTRNQLYLFIYL